jgi:2-furoyl-CoA dehydrogenase large subunit
VEDEALLRGRGWFMDDLDPLPNTAHAAILRSTAAHARIASLDVSGALEVDGVLGVLTPDDVRELSRPFPSALGDGLPFYASAVDRVRYVGEPVCVVLARDRYVAEDALERIVVDYEPLPVVASPAAALAGDAPPIHEALGSNVASERRFAYGDPDAAFARADVVVRERFRHPRSAATPVETYGVVADWDAVGDAVTAWSNFQGPFTLHGVAAAALGIRPARLRLLTPADSGGSFGVKAGVYVYVVLLAIASRRFGVPVRWTEDRVEHLLASSSATERLTEVEAAFAADGELLGLRLDLVDDVGAYVRAPEPATLYRMHGCLTGAYRVQDLAVRSRVVLTNRPPSGLNRGFGGPQLYFALERTMAIAARRLGLDPAELARRNLVRADQIPYRAAAGSVYDSGDYERCLDEVLRLAGYDDLRAEQARPRDDGRLLGVGLACVVEPSVSNMGYITLAQTAEERALGLPKSGNTEGVTMAIGPHGGVTVRFTTTPQGQGHRTVAAQVVADVLGVDPADVDVRADADTAANPWTVSSGNYSSRFAVVGASAVHRAAEQLSARLRAIAAPILEAEADAIELVEGRARVVDDPERSVSLRRLIGSAHWDHRRPAGRRRARPGRDRELHAAAGRAGRCRPRQLVGHLRLHRRPRGGAGRPADRRGRGARLRHGPRCRPHPQPAHRRGPDPRRPRARPRRRAARGAPLRRGRQPADGHLRRLPAADRDRAAACALADGGVAVAADAARRQGPRRGQHDERPRGDRQRGGRRHRARRCRAAADPGPRLGAAAAVKPSPLATSDPPAWPRPSPCWPSTAGDAKALAGGQSLVPLLNLRLAHRRGRRPQRVEGLDAIGEADGELRIGALVRQRALERHPPSRAAAC